MSTADCERDFIILKLIKTASQIRLSTENLQKLMKIKIDGGFIEEFPFPDALKKGRQACVWRTTTTTVCFREGVQCRRKYWPISAAPKLMQSLADIMDYVSGDLASQPKHWAESQRFNCSSLVLCSN